VWSKFVSILKEKPKYVGKKNLSFPSVPKTSGPECHQTPPGGTPPPPQVEMPETRHGLI